MAGPRNGSGSGLERGVHGLPVFPWPQETQQGHRRWVIGTSPLPVSSSYLLPSLHTQLITDTGDCDSLITANIEEVSYNSVSCWVSLFIPVSSSDTVLYTAREKEKSYTSDQDDPEVVQPYAAYSPAGQPKVKSFTLHIWNSVFKDP